MKKSTATKFPNSIDDRFFLSDISISRVPLMNEYQMILKSGDYTRASELLNNSDVFFYGAWLLNALENRLCAIGEVLINEDEHTLMTYNDLEPSELTNIYENMNWISDGDLTEF